MGNLKDWMKNNKIATGVIIVLGLGILGNLNKDEVEGNKVEKTPVTQEQQVETTQTKEDVKDEYPKSPVKGKFKVGDSVEIVNLGAIYATHEDFFKEYNLPTQSWEYGAEEVKLNGEYKVVYLNKHSEGSDIIIYLIEDVETKQTYLFEEGGLSKYDRKGKVKTASYMEKFIEENKEAPTKEETDVSIPTEYINALKKAKIYSDTMNMSKAGLYDQLTSEYGEKFSKKAAKYAIDNVNANWKENALKKAKTYQESMAMSPSAIYDQLTSEYGEKFTKKQAQYAIDNLE